MAGVCYTSGHAGTPCSLQCAGMVSCGAFVVKGGQVMTSYRSLAKLQLPFAWMSPLLCSKPHMLAYESGGIHVE